MKQMSGHASPLLSIHLPPNTPHQHPLGLEKHDLLSRFQVPTKPALKPERTGLHF